ncbi:hypothetical protein DAI22_09g147750 [Oryza sativa Japonica Group]|nr:hypothetical protein DAI22_09g147750 [Oryza sativa Japonica Group]
MHQIVKVKIWLSGPKWFLLVITWAGTALLVGNNWQSVGF